MAKIDTLRLKYRVQKRSTDALTRIDPTSNGKYLEWLFKMKFVKRGEKYFVNKEFPSNYNTDVARILRWMEKNSNNPKFKTEYKDINYFKTVSSLIKTMGPLCVPSKKEIKEQITKVFEDERWLIIVPKTFAASKLYGMGTTWCTTQKTYFNQYTKRGPLYYIIDKSIDRKFGVSVTESSSMKLNTRNLTFYNNEDNGLNVQTLRNVYGSEVVNMLIGHIDRHYGEIMVDKVRKRVLKDAMTRLRQSKDLCTKYNIFNSDETNKLFDELMSSMAEAC